VKDRHLQTTLLRNARLILPDRIVAKSNLLLHGARVAQILEPTQLPAADSVIDIDGFTVFPGFIDVHIHGAAGVDTNDTGSDGLRTVSRFLVRNGVTAWLPTLVPDSEDNYLKSITAIDEFMRRQAADENLTGSLGSRVLGVHYEGPFVNEHQCGALRSQFFKTFAAGDELQALPRLQCPGAVHMITIAPEVKGGIVLVRQLVQHDWIVSLGHTRATIEFLDQALTAGARHMTHFMNAMPPLHQRAPGPVGWGLLHDDVTCDIIADGQHLDPAVLSLLVKLKGVDGLALISDAIAAAGLGDGDYSIWGEAIDVKDGRTSNAQGSIAGSVITLLDAVQRMLSLGVSEIDVARMASTNPARLLRIDGDYGAIAEGKRADLVALDQTGKVGLVIIEGQVVFRLEPRPVANG
jgi:N-acetylglucosamine-6-phosphate deacetylase